MKVNRHNCDNCNKLLIKGERIIYWYNCSVCESCALEDMTESEFYGNSTIK